MPFTIACSDVVSDLRNMVMSRPELELADMFMLYWAVRYAEAFLSSSMTFSTVAITTEGGAITCVGVGVQRGAPAPLEMISNNTL